MSMTHRAMVMTTAVVSFLNKIQQNKLAVLTESFSARLEGLNSFGIVVLNEAISYICTVLPALVSPDYIDATSPVKQKCRLESCEAIKKSSDRYGRIHGFL